MNVYDALRYGLWGLVAWTADANRRHYGMTTAWLPHLAANSLSLLLPDVIRPWMPRRPTSAVVRVAQDMIAENDTYVAYVAPLAAGYILSHPSFNIYKGDMAEIRVAGFGLDALPHSATAMALTMLVEDTVESATRARPENRFLRALVRWCAERPALTSLGVLALVTFGWEYAEYKVNKHEMAIKGSAEDINMQWSVDDTAHDVASNMLGWLAGAIFSELQRSREEPSPFWRR